MHQAANAVKAKGSIVAIVYRQVVPRLGHAQAIGAITHRLPNEVTEILHQGLRYEERGPPSADEANKVRVRKMIRELRSLGYCVDPPTRPSSLMPDDFRPWLIRTPF